MSWSPIRDVRAPGSEADRSTTQAPRPTGATSRRVRATLPDPTQLVPPPRPPSPTAPPAPPLGRRDRRRLETFERLICAARTVLFTRDIRHVAVEDITSIADVGKGTFFNYFSTKELVAAGLLIGFRRGLAAAVADVQAGGMTAPERWLMHMQQYFHPPTGDWLIYEQNVIHCLLSPEVREAYSPHLHEHRHYHVRLMELGQAQQSIRTDLPSEDVGTLAQLLAIGLTMQFWIQNTPPTPELVSGAVDRFVRVLVPPPVAPAAPAPPRSASARPTRRRRKAAATQAAPRKRSGRTTVTARAPMRSRPASQRKKR
ncbi:MAG: TetR/AcrR family transcriptional regulator [Vicinamibacterales bacterium]